MSKSFLLISLSFIIAFFPACIAPKPAWPPHDWPANVVSNMWIPKDVKTLIYDQRELYLVTYTADACYPAKNLINDMVNTMTMKGWERLDNDPLNPSGGKLNHTIDPEGKWNSGLDKDMLKRYDWREFWKDS